MLNIRCSILDIRCLMLDICLMHLVSRLTAHGSWPKFQPAPGVRGPGDTGLDLARARSSRPQAKVIVG